VCHAALRIRKRCFHLAEKLGQGFVTTLLRLERGELLRRELAAFGIRKQAVCGTRNVTQMEGDRGQPQRLRVDFGVRPALQSIWSGRREPDRTRGARLGQRQGLRDRFRGATAQYKVLALGKYS